MKFNAYNVKNEKVASFTTKRIHFAICGQSRRDHGQKHSLEMAGSFHNNFPERDLGAIALVRTRDNGKINESESKKLQAIGL